MIAVNVCVIILSHRGLLMDTLSKKKEMLIIPKHTILVVDDESAIRDMMCIALEGLITMSCKQKMHNKPMQ